MNLVHHRTKQVEILSAVLEELDPKLKALGIVEVHGVMIYAFDEEIKKSPSLPKKDPAYALFVHAQATHHRG